MIMQEWPIEEAEGAILAHSIPPLKKGRVLTAADVSNLKALGLAHVLAARLETHDVHEDEAAGQLASALNGPHAFHTPPFTGRSNLYSSALGLAQIDTDAVAKINAVHEAITLATVAPFEPVRERMMLATVKIIPFAVPARALEQAIALAGGVIRVAPFAPKNVALVSTRLTGLKDSLLDKNRAVLDERLERLGSRIGLETRTEHTTAPLAQALDDAQKRGAQIICVVGASAIVDRGDVIPQAILRAGGEIIRYGMPVDPGNLLLLGKLGDAPVIGLPGCARSPKRNGFDFVLERLCADLPVTAADIAAMGAGGLLKEIPSRPSPREAPSKPRRTKVAALILAAGSSRRMGSNKLLADIHGMPVIAHVLRRVTASAAWPVFAVLKPGDTALEQLASRYGASIVHNPQHAEGMASSIRAGIAALPEDTDAVLLFLGDMPGLQPEDIETLIRAFTHIAHVSIVLPVHEGKQGHPVLLAREHFPELLTLQGDIGARAIVASNADAAAGIPISNPGVVWDADTPEALERLRTLIR